LFDFDREIYGRYVEVHFKQKIRDEMRFQSLDELKVQIVKDVAEAKAALSSRPLAAYTPSLVIKIFAEFNCYDDGL
jgi:Riboflavin kinase.